MAENDPGKVTMTVVGRTDVGRVREHNEDAFLVLDRGSGRRAGDGERMEIDLQSVAVFAVADGMGGAAAGEVASSMTVERVAATLGGADFSEATPDQISSLMDQSVQEANSEILAEAQSNTERQGMGTTATAAVATAGRVYIAQVGDSRGYLLRKGKLVQLTKDQSLIGQLIEEGTLTEEEAEQYGARNIVLQAVGVEEKLRVDTKHWEVLRGDVIMLCSDGLLMIKDDQIEQILRDADGDMRQAVENLIDAANDAGGRDNITVVCAKFDGEGLRAPLEAMAADGVDRAGAGFQAPPPPEVANPMKKVMAALAVLILVLIVLFVVLKRTTATLKVAVAPGSVDALVVVTQDGTEIRSQSGTAVTLEDIEPGEYLITASAEGFFDDSQKLTITEAGDIDVSLELQPKPGQLSITVGTNHVEVHVVAVGGNAEHDPAFEQTFTLQTGAPKKYEQIPSGTVFVEVSREGFEPVSQEVVLAPLGEEAMEFGPLTAVTGEVRVHCSEAGVAVVIKDAHGEELFTGTTPGGGDALTAGAVRVGNHEVSATKIGFSVVRIPVEVVKSPPVDVTLDIQVERVNVTFRGPKGVANLFRTDVSPEEDLGRILIRDNGQSNRASRLPPGSYKVVWVTGAEKAFDVKPGDADKSVEAN